MSNIVLRLQKVTKFFGGKGDVPSVEIFNEMDFTIKRNEVVGLFELQSFLKHHQKAKGKWCFLEPKIPE